MSYHDHQNPPSEEMFFDFLKKRNEVGISSNYMEDSYRCLCRVYLYLYGEEFDSSKVQEYVSVESSKNGICPYCNEVSAIFGFNLDKKNLVLYRFKKEVLFSHLWLCRIN